jgi:hypothetical protein
MRGKIVVNEEVFLVGGVKDIRFEEGKLIVRYVGREDDIFDTPTFLSMQVGNP